MNHSRGVYKYTDEALAPEAEGPPGSLPLEVTAGVEAWEEIQKRNLELVALYEQVSKAIRTIYAMSDEERLGIPPEVLMHTIGLDVRFPVNFLAQTLHQLH